MSLLSDEPISAEEVVLLGIIVVAVGLAVDSFRDSTGMGA